MSDISMNLPLHDSNIFFELWTDFFPLDGYESDIIDPSGITQNFNIPSGITQSINTVFTNLSNRNRYIPLFNDDVIMRTITTSFDEDGPKYKNILSEKGKSTIKFINFESEKFPNQSSCLISQEKFEKNQTIALLPCGHIFDKKSVMKWLETENASCPACRFKLDSIEEEIKKEPEPPFTIENLFNYIDRSEQEREQDDIQRAIMESLNDVEGPNF